MKFLPVVSLPHSFLRNICLRLTPQGSTPPYQHPQASVGDCREIEKDRENFENILAFLTCYNKLNAVVVLLKPNNATLTVAFQFCVLELIFDPPP